MISLLCGVNCPVVEIKGSFVSCPTFRRHYPSPHLYLRNLFVGGCQGSIRDNAEAGTHRSGLGAIGLIWGPPLCSLPLLIHHGPDSWTDCRPPSTKRGRLTTPGPLPGGEEGGVEGCPHGLQQPRDKCWLSVQGQRRAGPGERKEIKKKKFLTTALSDEGYG